MLIEEEPKSTGEINPDVLEEGFEVDIAVDEDVLLFTNDENDEEADEIDIAFAANDEGYW